MRGGVGDSKRIAVIIPLYGQAQFVVEAVASVLRQTLTSSIVVIVNDGCPDPDSDIAGRTLAAANPNRVIYLHQRNRGLSGARNAGIKYALAAMPDLVAVLPLDADNYLHDRALEVLLDRLQSDDSIDWVSPHLEMFGATNRPWTLVPKFTRFRQLFENQADAVALFRTRVFVEGATYDESMRHGYEDWELYLDQLLAGRVGVTEPAAIMFYRSRPHSMLAGASARDEAIRRDMRAKHRKWYLPRARTLLEHVEHPRFALVDELGETSVFTDPLSAERVASGASVPRTPVTVIGMRDVIAELRRSGLLPGLLYVGHPTHANAASVVVVTNGSSISVERREVRSGAAASILIIPTALIAPPAPEDDPFTHLESLRKALRCAAELSVTLVAPEWLGPESVRDDQLIRQAKAAGARVENTAPDEMTCSAKGFVSDADFMRWMHEHVVSSTFPLVEDGHRHLGFAMPWLKLGGVEHCVLQVAKALREVDPTLRIHLALTEDGRVATDPALTVHLFDSITSFAGIEWGRREEMVDRWCASMDVVINAHSGVTFSALRRQGEWPQSERHTLSVAYLHVLDLTPDGMKAGWPIVAAEMEGKLDRFLVISRGMAAMMRNEGVPPRKITVGPNAPVIRPSSLDVALRMAHEKATRLAAGGHLRILIAGRLDYQKGGRRAAHAIRTLTGSGHDFHVTVLGAPTLESELPELPPDRCSWHPATNDARELSAAFAAADVLLLLSRWEGVPLAMLDAMTHGTVVVATDVGAIAEVAKHGVTALLIPCEPGVSDESIGSAAAVVLSELAADPTGSLDMRTTAAHQAWTMSWNTTAEKIIEMVETSREAQR